MALVTLRILDGPERGAIYCQVATPITLGREEGNTIRLNDERISRYHLRVTEDDGSVLLTDLQSTNGTRVNGESVNVWTLRPGDLIMIGRSLLLVGSAREIAGRLRAMREESLHESVPMGGDQLRVMERVFSGIKTRDTDSSSLSSSPFEAEIFQDLAEQNLEPLHLLPPPVLPRDLPPKQTAQLAEFLLYMQLRLRYLITGVTIEEGVEPGGSDRKTVHLELHQWQNLLDLSGRIALLLHAVNEP